MTPLVLTSGEPAGIGPDLCVALAQTPLAAEVVVLADAQLLITRAAQLGLPFAPVYHDLHHVTPPNLRVMHMPLAAPVSAGELDKRNAAYVLGLLDRAMAGCMSGEFAAMVTGPVHKGIINEAGIPFTGHTEYLAEKLNTPRVVMVLVGEGLRVALATTHLPLREVPDAIDRASLEETVTILDRDLRQRFGIPTPTILVCALNPHGGEGGHLGSEEIDIIAPAIAACQAKGVDCRGPYPADTLFVRDRLAGSHCILAMYHDQGLGPLKMACFGEAVNVTLGLPVIRTSVDHGVALDKAGTGRASLHSLEKAIKLARELAERKNS